MTGTAPDVEVIGERPPRRLELPGGWLHVERPLPFLFVNRSDASAVELGARLVVPQPSHLVMGVEPAGHGAASQLVDEVVESAVEEFGGFLLVEVWVAAPGGDGPEFLVRAPVERTGAPGVDHLVRHLEAVEAFGQPVAVRVVDDECPAPPGMPALLDEDRLRTSGTVAIGLEVPALLHDPASGVPLPIVARDLSRELTVAFRHLAAGFCAVQTSLHPREPSHFGRRSLVAAERRVDRALVELAGRFDELLLSTPLDVDEAWADFAGGGHRHEPRFRYPPLPVDPAVLKRDLWAIPIEAVEDPTLADLFRSKRRELDRTITMLLERQGPAFLRDSLSLYGGASPSLLALAEAVLERLADRGPPATEVAGAGRVADAVRREMGLLAGRLPGFDRGVVVRPDVAGIITSAGNVLIGDTLQIDARRLDALVQHEVGVHVVTHVNGAQQPLALLSRGLAGYVATQEGLGVVAEYATGGLTPERFRILAARVVAVASLLDGATFADTYHELSRRADLAGPRAFRVAMRVHRGGGLTKDAGYLQGFHDVVGYLAGGGELDNLLVGKLSIADAPLVDELRTRGVLGAPRLRPRWTLEPAAVDRLDRIRAGATTAELVAEVLDP